MAGGGRNGELMKVKASGGETLHAATGATFSSVASTSCQETQLIGLEKLGVGGVQRKGGGGGGVGVASGETRQRAPSNPRPPLSSAWQQQLNSHT